MKKFRLFFLVALILVVSFIIFKNSSTYDVIKWNNAVKNVSAIAEGNNTTYATSSPKDSWEKELDTLYDAKITINQAFMKNYAKKNEPVKLLSDLSLLTSLNGTLSYSKNKLEELTPTVLSEIERYYNIKSIPLPDYIKSNTGTYYVDNPNAEPQMKEPEQVTAMTSIDSNGRGRYQTKENTIEIEHYGDYALTITTRWNFDDGELGWYGGIFIDKPGKGWTSYEQYDLYYKGKFVERLFDSEFNSALVFPKEVDNKIFYIHPSWDIIELHL